MAIYVIDSWPVVEWLQDKPAAQAFSDFLDANLLSGATFVMSRINYGEIVYSLAKVMDSESASDCLDRFCTLPILILSVDDSLVDEAVSIKSRYPLSYADCFAAALAVRYSAPVVTGDCEFFKLRDDGLLTLEWMGA